MAKKPDATFMDSLVETIKTIVYALLIAGVFRTIFFQPFWIPSGSMKDTLLIGDFLFVNKMAYGYSYASCPAVRIIGLDADDFCFFIKNKEERIFGSDPERGDVVVFRHPVSGVDFIKRLIGMPGDKVQMIDGVVHINGFPAQQKPDGQFIETMERQGPQRNTPRCKEGAVGQGGDCSKDRYIETLPNGVEHSVLDTFNQASDNTKVYTVPEGHFFFMGDNRDNSTDSRYRQPTGVGFVPRKDIVGRADRVIFSSAGTSILAFWTWRSDRYFKAIN